jgi:hypothetical protein
MVSTLPLRHELGLDLHAGGLEQPGLLGQRQRREAGPAGHADGDLGHRLRARHMGRGQG